MTARMAFAILIILLVIGVLMKMTIWLFNNTEDDVSRYMSSDEKVCGELHRKFWKNNHCPVCEIDR